MGELGSALFSRAPSNPSNFMNDVFSSVCVYLVLSEKEKTGPVSGTPHIHSLGLL